MGLEDNSNEEHNPVDTNEEKLEENCQNSDIMDSLLNKGDVGKLNHLPSSGLIEDLASLVRLVANENQQLVTNNEDLRKEIKSIKSCLRNTMEDLEKSKVELREIQGSLMRATVENLAMKQGKDVSGLWERSTAGSEM